MRGNLHQALYLVKHDPVAVAGFLLIGGFAVLWFHIQLKMVRAGYKTSGQVLLFGWDTPMQYLKVRSRHDWSPWPAYLLWPCLLAGVIGLVFGLFRL